MQVQSTNHILRRGVPDTDLERHARKLGKSGSKVSAHRQGHRRPQAAVLLHALLVTGEVFGRCTTPVRAAAGSCT
ncbi:MAG: hypothetical protein EA416_08505 [Trueperaceae bacterium]|nr:MAG: hypothetical protein EA416_08505 [Trueperaceae bacterium]